MAWWKPGLGMIALGVAEHRLDDDRGDLVALALEQAAQEVDVVVAGRDDRVGDRSRDAPRPRPGRTGLSASPSSDMSSGATLIRA